MTTTMTGVQMIVQQPAITVAWLIRSFKRVGARSLMSLRLVAAGNFVAASMISRLRFSLRRCIPFTKDQPSAKKAANANSTHSV